MQRLSRGLGAGISWLLGRGRGSVSTAHQSTPSTAASESLPTTPAGQAWQGLESLEQRVLLSTTITVTSLADVIANDGVVTLREAIIAANTDADPSGDTPAGNGADVIDFDSALFSAGAGSVALSAGELSIESDVTIDGPADAQLTIADGDTTPDAADDTDFGSPPVGGVAQRTFSVTNTGDATVTLDPISVPAGYFLSQDWGAGANLGPGQSATFTVDMDTTHAVGTVGGDVSFAVDGNTANPYNFAVTGSLLDSEVSVEGNGQPIESGLNTPNDADFTLFPDVGKGVASQRTFTVYNTGAGLLTTNLVAPSGFTIVEGLDATIAPGGSDTFTLGLDTATAGAKLGTVTINTNDVDEGTFTFRVYGRVADFVELRPPTQTGWFVQDISADGQVIVGWSFNAGNGVRQGWRWTPTGGLVGVSDYDGGPSYNSFLFAVSGDGNTAVGTFQLDSVPNQYWVGRWTTTGGWELIGQVDAGYSSQGLGISSDGSTIIGNGGVDNSFTSQEAFRWTDAGGFEPLGYAPGLTISNAAAVSADGSVVVGSSGVLVPPAEEDSVPFRWTAGGGMEALTALDGVQGPDEALDVSDDGEIVVGHIRSDAAFRWTEATGVEPLPSVPGQTGDDSAATGISGDGKSIVGYANIAGQHLAAVWNDIDGGRDLSDVLTTEFGIDLGGVVLKSAVAVSADGQTITGSTGNLGVTAFWVATLPPELPAPAADAGGPYFVQQGTSIQLDASGTLDPDQDPATLTYEWDLDGDGIFGETGAAATRGDEVGTQPTFSAAGLTAPDLVTVSLRVTDSDQFVNTVTADITITEPEITVEGNGVSITSGDAIPDPADYTDFGVTPAGGPALTRTFTVRNDGGTGSPLLLGTVTLPPGYTLTDPLVSSLDPGQSDDFTVELAEPDADVYAGTITIASNDDDENPFTFAVTGTVDGPEIAVESGGTGQLFFVEQLADGLQDGNGTTIESLGGPGNVAVSPDGKHVYAASVTDSTITVFDRDSMTGALTAKFVYQDTEVALLPGAVGVDSLQGATAIKISSDGKYVYFGADTDLAVSVFSRNASTGALTRIQVFRNDTNSDAIPGSIVVSGINRPLDIELSPDGLSLYVVGFADQGSHEIATFDVNSTTGLLTWVAAQTSAGGGNRDISMHPDGTFLVTAEYLQSQIAVYRRDTMTGGLTRIQVVVDGALDPEGNTVDGIAGNFEVTYSPDGQFLYVLGTGEDSIGVFQVRESDGKLLFRDIVRDGDSAPGGGTVNVLADARAFNMSRDGRFLWVTDQARHAVGVFERDEITGGLAFVGRYRNGDVGGAGGVIDGLTGAIGAFVSPDDEHVYVRGGNGPLVVFQRDVARSMTDGDTTSGAADYTDFGRLAIGVRQPSRTFFVHNTGTDVLNITGLNVPAGFQVTSGLPASIAAGASASFTVKLVTAALGVFQGDISIENDDVDENPFNFTITGEVITPDIAVEGNGMTIVDGDATPDPADDTDFGKVHFNGPTATRTFTIRNTGTDTLDLTGGPLVAIGGPDAAAFAVTRQPATSIAPGGFTTFDVTFDPAAPGPHAATISIDNDDLDEDPYDFAIGGTGTGPQITVTSLADVIADDGVVTLREAIVAANTDMAPSADTPAGSGADVIEFDPALLAGGPATIMLTGGELVVSDDLTIDGPGSSQLTLDANVLSRLFRVTGGATSLTINGLTLRRGAAPTADVGGAIRASGTLNIADSVITLSTSPGDGGGIYLNSNATLTLTNSTVSNNSAGDQGGGIYNAPGSVANIIDSVVSDNQTLGAGGNGFSHGGGVFSQGLLSVIGSTFNGNDANGANAYGGGIYVDDGSASIVNSSITSNTAQGGGAGVTIGSHATLSVDGSTVYGNTAADELAGGIDGGGGFGAVSLRNTIVAGNDNAGSDNHRDMRAAGLGATITSLGYNLIGVAPPNFTAAPGDLAGTTAVPLDPMLAPLSDNGGPTRTHALLAGSPAIDAGNDAAASITDQRGFARVADGDGDGATRVDIGAFERNSKSPIIVTTTGDAVANDGQVSLREAILAANMDSDPSGDTPPGNGADIIVFDPAMFIGGPATIDLTAALADLSQDVTIRGPTPLAGDGGGLTVRRDTGGDYRVFNVAAGVTVAIEYLTIANGRDATGAGVRNDGTLSLAGVTLTANTATGNGGAIFNAATGTLSVTNSTISGNTATGGGGGGGGGIYTNGAVTLTSDTIVQNTTSGFTGGGVLALNAAAQVMLVNTVIALNTSAFGQPDLTKNSAAAITSNGHNLIGDGTGSTLVDGVNDDQVGAAGSLIDPMLGPLQDNGGSTFTHALLPGSSAVDRGVAGGLTFDQRGAVRPFDDSAIANGPGSDGADVGAVEVAPHANVQGNGVDVADDDATPAVGDDTDFGQTEKDQPGPVHTFTVQNTGDAPLVLGGVSVPGRFILTQDLPASIDPGQSATFSVQLDTTITGMFTGEVSFATNDIDRNPYNFTITATLPGPEIAVEGNGVDIADGDGTPDPTDHTDFGSVNQGDPVLERTFTVRNVGLRTMTITNLTVPAGFTVTESLDASIDADASDTFTVKLTAADGAVYSGDVVIESDDADEGTFTFAITATIIGPELTVLGNGVVIGNGDNTPDPADFTRFEDTMQGLALPTRTYTVRNDGTATLTFVTSLFVLSGFSVVDDLVASLEPNESDTIVIQLDSTAALGTTAGGVAFGSDDVDEANFTFAVSATVIEPITVEGNGQAIAPGDDTPDASDGTDFASVIKGEAGPMQTFTLRNDGGVPVTLADLAVPAGYTVFDGLTSAVLDPGQSDDITVRLDGAATGTKTGQISFTSNANALAFTVTGDVVAPITIVESLGAVPITDGDVSPTDTDDTDLGSVPLDGPAPQATFRIRNDAAATAPLVLGDVIVPFGFLMVTPPAMTTLQPGESTTFTIARDTSVPGVVSGQVVIPTNDADHDPFDFKVRGNVTGSPALLGPETLVNTSTTGDQRDVSIAHDEVGNFVIAWSSYEGFLVNYRLYDATGAPVTNELQSPGAPLLSPEVAMAPDGKFVIVLQTPSGGLLIAAHLYDADGMVANTFQVSSIDDETNPNVAVNDAGEFAISWASHSKTDVRVRRYHETGAPAGNDFVVNPTPLAGTTQINDVTMSDTGRLVVVWPADSANGDADGTGVFGRIYDATDSPLGDPFQLSETSQGDQYDPKVEFFADESFVAVWASNAAGQDGDGSGIFARLFNSDGTPLTAEFPVNTTTAGDQFRPYVALGPGGDFVIAWRSADQDGSAQNVYAQRFHATGAPVGNEFRLNTTTDGNQSFTYGPPVTWLPTGDIVGTWQGNGPGDDFGVFLQRFSGNESPIAHAGGPYAAVEGDSIQLDASLTSDPDQDAATLTYEWDLDGDGVFGETGTDAARGDEVGINPTVSAAGIAGPGFFIVALRVTDDEGMVSLDSMVVDVTDLGLDVSGNDLVIVAGDSMPDAADGTDFGVHAQNGPAPQQVFRVLNVGTATVGLSDLTVPAGFSIVEGLSATLDAGQSDTFTVRFETAAGGVFTGPVGFTVDGGPVYQFAVTGRVNHAPELADTDVRLFVRRDVADVDNAGTLVAELVGGVSDVDAGAQTGIAVTAIDETAGTLQFSLDGGVMWSDIGAVSDSSALLLPADGGARLRLRPNAGLAGPVDAVLRFRAWDQTAGAAGDKVDTTANGGGSAFSTATDTADAIIGFIVTATADAGAGSLRQAILDANAAAGDDLIAFNIAPGGVQTIQPTSALPTITQAVTIDGWTQPGFAAAPVIELDGTNAGALANGLHITSGGSTVRGLLINRFASLAGILLDGGAGNVIQGNYLGANVAGTMPLANHDGIVVNNSSFNVIGTNGDGVDDLAERNLISGNTLGVSLTGAGANNNVVAGNYVGTDAAGASSLANTSSGVSITSAAHDNRVGSNGNGVADVFERNVISGNSTGVLIGDSGTTGNVVAGNFIGTDVTGTLALGNTSVGVDLLAGAQMNRIGTDADGLADADEANVISGNGSFGVNIDSSNTRLNIVAGNFIGTDVTGAAALPNGGAGVRVHGGASDNTIGGLAPGAGNVIAFAGVDGGVNIEDASTGNAILGNAVFANAGPGIDLGGDGLTPNDPGDGDDGPNHLQNFPNLAAAQILGGDLVIRYVVDSAPANSVYDLRVELFKADSPASRQGRTFIVADTYDAGDFAAGFVTVNLGSAAALGVGAGDAIVATATDADGNTSEFSAAVTVEDAPEIEVTGNAMVIVNGDDTPGAGDGTDFGSVEQGQANPSQTFIVSNDAAATGALNLSGLSVPAGFVIVDGLVASLAPGQSDQLTLELDATTVGSFSGVVSFDTNDLDEDPFSFTVTGEVASPLAEIHGRKFEDLDGDGAFEPGNGESVLAGWVIYLDANGDGVLNNPVSGDGVCDEFATEPCTQTDVTGAYGFVDLEPGTYVVREVGQLHWRQTFPGGDGAHSVMLVPGQNEQDVDFANQAQPEIDVRGNGQSIADGDTTPDPADDTDFAAVHVIGESVDRTFTIVNVGVAALNLTGNPRVQIGGPNAGDFTVVSQPASTVAPMGGSTQFLVRFDPSGAGQRDATITIASDDLDETMYDFAITGVGQSPDVTVLGGGQNIADGDTTPQAADGTDFGAVEQGQAGPVRVFDVSNNGDAPLNIMALNLPAGFVLVDGLDAVLGPGLSDSFTVQLITTTRGTYTGQVSIDSDDPDENPFNFTITGQVTEPQIAVQANAQPIADGDDTPDSADGTEFGVVLRDDSPPMQIFTVSNVGDAPLQLGMLSVPDGFIVTDPLPTVLNAGGIDTFAIRLDTSRVGTFEGQVSFANNDRNENPFNFAIHGRVRLGEISGTVFEDEDRDQMRGAMEPGIAGAVVFLDQNGNGVADQVSASVGSSDVPHAVLDLETVTSQLDVSGPVGLITDVDVTLNIAHAFDADLDVYLISPWGTRVELFTDVGDNGVNFTNTTLDDEASSSIVGGVAPFTGVFRPEGSLSAFDGQSAVGAWQLEISDDAAGDSGELIGWSLVLTVQEQFTTSVSDDPSTPGVDETGAYVLADLPAGIFTVRQIVPAGFQQTAPAVAGGGGHDVPLAFGELASGRDFGNRRPNVDVLGVPFSFIVPGPLVGGATFSVSFQVQAVGPDDTGPFAVDFYLSDNNTISAFDRLLGTFDVTAGVAGGGTTGPLMASLTLPVAGDAYWGGDGVYFVGMIVDARHDVFETDESNNRNQGVGQDFNFTQINGTSPPRADFVASDVTIAGPVAGQQVTVTATVSNSGAAFSGDVGVDFYVDGVRVGNDVITFDGMSAPVADPTFDLTIPAGDAGSRLVRVEVDPDFLVAESDEVNNVLERRLTWEHPAGPINAADLIVSAWTAAGSTAEGRVFTMGQSVELSAVVANIGDQGASASDVAFYLGTSASDLSRRIGAASIGALAAGADEAALLTYQFDDGDEGARYLIVSADDGGAVAEASEANNRLVIGPIRVVSPGLGGSVSSANAPKAINDAGVTRLVLSVDAFDGRLADMDVLLDIDHASVGDLEAVLISPWGQQVTLFDQVGGNGENFIATVLDDEASLAISAGSAPFTGRLRPSEALSTFDGRSPRGDWILQITDHHAGNAGVVRGWSLRLASDNPQLQVADAAGFPGQVVPLIIAAQVTGDTGTEVADITIANVPGGAMLSAGNDHMDGTWSLTEAQLAGLTIQLPDDSDQDILLTVTASTTIDAQVLASSATLLVRVDVFTLEVSDASGNENTAIPLDVTAALFGAGNPFSLSIDIQGVPTGAALSAGVDHMDGTWTLTPAQLAGLSITPAMDDSDDLALTVVATASNGVLMVSQTRALSVFVAGVPDVPALMVADAAGVEDQGVVDRGFLAGVSYAVAGAAAPAPGSELKKWSQPGGVGTAVYISYSYSDLLDGTLAGGLSVNQIRAAVEAMFALWAGVAPLHFVEQPDSGPDPRQDPNGDYAAAGHPLIRIGQRPIDDKIAFTTRPNAANAGRSGDVHIDSGRTWTLSPAMGVIDLRELILHELGHALGLPHDANSNAIMFADYIGRFTTGANPVDPFLTQGDIGALQALYGSGQGSVTPLFPPAIPLDITAAQSGSPEPSEVLTLRIEGVPAGAVLSAGQDQGGGVWLMQAHEIAGLMIRPPANSDADFDLTVIAIATDGQNTAQSQGVIHVALTAVADTPLLALAKTSVSGDQDTAIPLPVTAQLADDDGSESLAVTISGVPVNVQLSAGVDQMDGTWTLSSAELVNLTLTAPPGAADFTLDITAVATEASNNDQASAQVSLDVTVIAIGPDAFEPDNTPAQASPIVKDELQAHSIYPAGDVDWLTFTIADDKTQISLRLRSPGNAGQFEADHLRVTLFGPDSPSVLLAQDMGDLTQSSLELGQYWVRIDDPAGAISNYTVQLDVSEPSGDTVLPQGADALTDLADDYEKDQFGQRIDSEPGAQNPVLTPDVTQNHTIHDPGDVDWMQFTLTDRAHVIIEITPTANSSGASQDTVLYLYNQAAVDGGTFESPLRLNNDGGAGRWSRLEFNLNPGTYYVLVNEFQNDDVINQYAITLTTPLPQVTAVRLAGSDWTHDYMQYLAAQGLGVDGRAVAVGSGDQLLNAPWAGVDQISIQLNQHVVITQGDLTITGVNVPSYTFSGFHYTSSTHTATWTLSTPIAADKIALHLADVVHNPVDQMLDGEWANPVDVSDPSSQNFPSGNGSVGGAFIFRLNVLVGDVDRNSRTDLFDSIHVRNHQFTAPGDAGYNFLLDLDANTAINHLDTLAAFNHQFTTLPQGEPLIAPPPGAAAPTPSSAPIVTSTFARELPPPFLIVGPPRTQPLTPYTPIVGNSRYVDRQHDPKALVD